jgi:hypothetical protein
MEKKIIRLTENDLRNIVKRVISEQKGKIFFAFDNDKTDFQGIIGKDGYLYPFTDTFETWKIGPISKVPYTGPVFVRIDKRNGKEIIMVANKNSDLNRLEMAPNYTVKKVNYSSIPKK